MTIDEEIKHQEEISDRYARMSEYEGNEGIAKDCAQCAADHRQLAEWLTDYKELKTKYSDVQEKIREIRGYLEFAAEHMNVMGVLEALDIIKTLMMNRRAENENNK